MEKAISIVMVALIVSALFGAITIPVSAVGEVTVTRSYEEGTEPGTANVTVSYTINTAITSLAIKENISSDWNITEQTSSPAATMYKDSTHEWLYLVPPGTGESGTITYTVSGPAGDTDTIRSGYNIGAGYVDTSSIELTLKGEDTEAPLTPTSPQTTPTVTSPTSNPTLPSTPAVTPTAIPPSTPLISTPVTTTPTTAPAASPSPTPKPPGFEAVFAIAGLLAVAYLVLRRKKR